MAIPMTRDYGRIAFGDLVATLPPAGFEQYRLGRLLELRAVIDSLRAERADRLPPDFRDPYERSRSRS